jgi:hypothetical protein
MRPGGAGGQEGGCREETAAKRPLGAPEPRLNLDEFHDSN